MPKNDIVRRRGDYPGEAGADWSYGATAKPEADEHCAQRNGLSGRRGKENRQGDRSDVSAKMRKPVKDETDDTAFDRSKWQHGAAVRGEPPIFQDPSPFDALPEGLRRERKGPYDKNFGRNEVASQVPKNWDPRGRG
jgi:hypothetical protein